MKRSPIRTPIAVLVQHCSTTIVYFAMVSDLWVTQSNYLIRGDRLQFNSVQMNIGTSKQIKIFPIEYIQ